MKKFELTYSPFTHEKTFLANGKLDTLKKCWGEDDSKELSEWCGDFFKALKDKYNDSEMEVCFHGIIRDREFLEDALEDYRRENPSDIISFDGSDCVNATLARLIELKHLFAKMQAETPFSELTTPELKGLFDKMVSNDFEMAVVGTMSSGKSTLINAMLGCDLLPTRNEAATATLARIHDIDGMNGFTGKSFDAKGMMLEDCDSLTNEDLERMNSSPETTTIEINGDIVGVESKDMKLVLTDTPGPNNSRTEMHKKHTFDLINADYKPMILYILDGTQPETNDDDCLLTFVADAMKTGGRQAQERFLFVLNKTDKFDSEKEGSIENTIEDVRAYLDRHGIKNARVFPASALMAKVIRQHLGNKPLTKKEIRTVLPKCASYVEDFLKEPSMFDPIFAPLSPSAQKELHADLDDAKAKEDQYREALILTGIPTIELAISEYLAKYALPAKIAECVLSFKNKLDSLGIEAREKERLANGETEVAKVKKELTDLLSLLNKGEKAKGLRDKIDELSSQKKIAEMLEKARAECQKPFIAFQGQTSRYMATTEEAAEWHSKLTALLQTVRAKFIADVENVLNSTIKEQAEKAVMEYKQYLGALVKDVTHKPPAAVLGAMASISVEESLDSFTRDVEVGHRKEKQRGVLGWIKRSVGWVFNEDWGYDDVPEYDSRVNFAEYLNSKVKPQVEEFFISTRKLAMEQAQEIEQEFKEFYKNKLIELDVKIKDILAKKEKALSSQKELECLIAENKRNLAWLDDFNSELEKVLSLKEV